MIVCHAKPSAARAAAVHHTTHHDCAGKATCWQCLPHPKRIWEFDQHSTNWPSTRLQVLLVTLAGLQPSRQNRATAARLATCRCYCSPLLLLLLHSCPCLLLPFIPDISDTPDVPDTPASWHTYMLLVYMHEVPDLGSKEGGIRRLDRYDQLAEYIWGERVRLWLAC